MNKLLTNFFTKGQNNSILLPSRSNFSFRGSWIAVQRNNTILDKFHLGDFSSDMYQIAVEFDSNEKETMQISVVARPDRAVVSIFGRASINQELINVTAAVDASSVYLYASPKSNTYLGSKVTFHATYAQAIHQLTPPAIVADTSTEETSGINTFDATTSTFDKTNVTFDRT